MFELPECVNLARQMRDELTGKRIAVGELGNTPHKFVWYNRGPEEFRSLTAGKRVGSAYARGRWIFVPFEPGFVLVVGECGGRILYHPPGARRPSSYHLHIEFEDESGLTVKTQMWGAMELYESGKELERTYIKDMRPTPVDEAFTGSYFSSLVDTLAAGEKRSVKGLLTQEQLIPGLGNSIAQDIMFQAGLHPKRGVAELSPNERRRLFESIIAVVSAVTAGGGREDELDLYGNRGGYRRIMDSRSAGQPCRKCGTVVEKMSYLGGACYFCPSCQPA